MMSMDKMTDNTDTELDLNPIAADLHSLFDILRWSVSRFNQAGLYYGHGTDNPWDEAIALALHQLYLPPDSIMHNEQLLQARLTTEEKLGIIALVLRRAKERIPVAYLTQQAWFCGHPFYVDERVLVPRSPFAELINKGFSEWLEKPPEHILDLCTGSACIAIALAYEFEHASVDAVDISEDALAVAEINIEEHGLIDRVTPLKSNLMDDLQGLTYDLIVSNPPYVDAEDMADLPEEFHHEPELGLAAGEDGLILVDRMLRQASAHLNPGGWLFVEVGNSEVHMRSKYADLNIHWVEFELGGHGVFAISKADLDAFFSNR